MTLLEISLKQVCIKKKKTSHKSTVMYKTLILAHETNIFLYSGLLSSLLLLCVVPF